MEDELIELEIYKELWNRITPEIVPEGWKPDAIQAFVKNKIEELDGGDHAK